MIPYTSLRQSFLLSVRTDSKGEERIHKEGRPKERIREKRQEEIANHHQLPCPASRLELSPRPAHPVHLAIHSKHVPFSTILASGRPKSSSLNLIHPPSPKNSNLERSSPITPHLRHPTTIPPSHPFQPRKVRQRRPPLRHRSAARIIRLPLPRLPPPRPLLLWTQTQSTLASLPTNPHPSTRWSPSSRRRQGVRFPSPGKRFPVTDTSLRGLTDCRRERSS